MALGGEGPSFPPLKALVLIFWHWICEEIQPLRYKGSMAFSWSVTRSSHHHLGVEIILARWYPWQQNEQTNTMMYGKGGRWRCWHSPMEGEGRRLRGPSPGLQLLPSSVSKPCCKWSWEMWDYVGSGWLLSTCVGGVLSSCCVRNSHVCGFLQCQALLNDNRVTGYDKRGKFSEFLEKETWDQWPFKRLHSLSGS